MRSFGRTCTTLGILFLLLAGMLFTYNEYENYQAKTSADHVMAQLVAEMKVARDLPDPYDTEMTEKEIDGLNYVGFLTIPTLNRNLPILSEWSDANLKRSPCRYYGSTKSDNLVIAAHNFRNYFGGIGSLASGDEVFFTDMDGVTNVYQVVEIEVLHPMDVEEMIAGDYDLTLFTCTYGGKTRITVRCEKKPSQTKHNLYLPLLEAQNKTA